MELIPAFRNKQPNVHIFVLWNELEHVDYTIYSVYTLTLGIFSGRFTRKSV